MNPELGVKGSYSDEKEFERCYTYEESQEAADRRSEASGGTRRENAMNSQLQGFGSNRKEWEI